MIRVRPYFSLGLILCAGGCAGLRQPSTATDPFALKPSQEVVVSESAATPRPVDPFHAQPVTPGTQMARWFPHLTKFFAQPASKVTETRRMESRPRPATGRPANEPSPPRELPDEALTARVKDRSAPPRPDVEADLSAAAPPPPILPVALAVETEPEPPSRPDAPSRPSTKPRPMPSPAIEPSPSLAGLSVRRMPPLPQVNPKPGIPAPDRPSRSRDEDSEAQLAKADKEDVPTQPLLAVSRLDPPAGALRRALEKPDPKDESAPPPADPFAEPAAAKPEPKAEGPPPLGDAPPHAARASGTRDRKKVAMSSARPKPRNVDPDTNGDPALAGRPRLHRGQLSVSRDDLQAEVPAASFPRTYYSQGAQGRRADPPKIDPDTQQTSLLKWRPRLLRRFWEDDRATAAK